MEAMRILVLMVLVAALFSMSASAANRYDYGCCLVPGGDCTPGDDILGTRDAFTQKCAENNGVVKLPAECNANQYCDMGCCCAGPNTPGSAAINATESLLQTTNWACAQKSTQAAPFTWSAKPLTQTCVSVCGGTTGGGGTATTYTLSGRVKRDAAGERATIWVAGTGVDTSVTTDSLGVYQITLPANKQYVLTVEPENLSCRPQTATVLLSRNKNDMNFNLDCTSQSGCANNKPEIINVVPEKGTNQASFDIKYNSACGDFDSFVPFVCEGTKPCQPLPRTTETHFVVGGLKPNTNYCFIVRAYETPIGMTESAKVCGLLTGDAACMQSTESSWCGTTATGSSGILSCDDKNKLLASACPAEKVCSVTSVGPQCVAKTDCAKCNGLFGLFASLPIRIPSGIENQVLRCGQNTLQCYKEDTFVPAYEACAQVTSCANYTSKQSCEADATTCKIGSCKWVPGSAELGTGVCTSTAQGAVPSCRQCTAGFGSCNKILCESISSTGCYYDGVDNDYFRDGKAECLPRSEMACRFYDTAAECGNARIDVTYSGRTSTGGTHARTLSNDKFGFGVCNWIAAGNKCVKNSDGITDAANPEDDCIEASKTGLDLLQCLNDTSAPTTQFVLKEPAVYGSSEINTLPFTVTDDVTPVEFIKTMVCATNTSTPCYPNMTLAQLKIDDVSSTYRIYYYSADRNANIEVVKNITVMARKDNVTRLTKITIEENE